MDWSLLRLAVILALLLGILADQLPSVGIAAPMLTCEAPDLPAPEECENSESEAAVAEDPLTSATRQRPSYRHIESWSMHTTNPIVPMHASTQPTRREVQSVLRTPLRC